MVPAHPGLPGPRPLLRQQAWLQGPNDLPAGPEVSGQRLPQALWPPPGPLRWTHTAGCMAGKEEVREVSALLGNGPGSAERALGAGLTGEQKGSWGPQPLISHVGSLRLREACRQDGSGRGPPGNHGSLVRSRAASSTSSPHSQGVAKSRLLRGAHTGHQRFPHRLLHPDVTSEPRPGHGPGLSHHQRTHLRHWRHHRLLQRRFCLFLPRSGTIAVSWLPPGLSPGSGWGQDSGAASLPPPLPPLGSHHLLLPPNVPPPVHFGHFRAFLQQSLSFLTRAYPGLCWHLSLPWP